MRSCLFILLFGCGAQSPPPPPEPPCTGETKLEPGVPGSPGHPIASALNPNGASQLATPMRAMLGDLKRVRASHLETGAFQALPLPEHTRIRCSWPTAPADRTPAFDAMAQVYLHSVRSYNASPNATTYASVVQGCLACHQNTCPGPMEAIRPLLLQP